MRTPAPLQRPEVLAPAGDEGSLRAAVLAGADAVYFGLKGFNARARAQNFDVEGLEKTLAYLHEHGVKGYVTLNTLVFDDELPSVEAAARACAKVGADAVIVQDLGVARLVRAVAPGLPIHASTQMTCTDAGAVEFAREMGASRVILARELSLEDIAAIRRETDLELEVFVHGALCVAYSGQCLTSEAIGGRSANRGACAQACRLPYEFVVDGELRDQGDRAYLLSPEDLEASELVPRLMELGVSAIKIEGRLKGPAYVAATTRLYRAAIEAAGAGAGAGTDADTGTGT
ncbi:MAG: U32 family peptidase, partial [Polyangiaceae bacterium]|nr:U32 family peptidase [Polyangiaceae bacterium]